MSDIIRQSISDLFFPSPLPTPLYSNLGKRIPSSVSIITAHVNGNTDRVTFKFKLLSSRANCLLFGGQYLTSFTIMKSGTITAPEGYSGTYDDETGTTTIIGKMEWYMDAVLIICGDIEISQ